MATDYARIGHDLALFYDFRDKAVLHVGAGGDGKLMEYAAAARSVIAIDTNCAAMTLLEQAVRQQPWGEKVSVLTADFYGFSHCVDVVLFEFCFHELADPVQGIDHARSLSSDIVIIDHVPASEWSGYAGETEKITRSWKALDCHPSRRFQPMLVHHTFNNYEELQQKFAPVGADALARIARFAGEREITIPMPYAMALI